MFPERIPRKYVCSAMVAGTIKMPASSRSSARQDGQGGCDEDDGLSADKDACVTDAYAQPMSSLVGTSPVTGRAEPPTAVDESHEGNISSSEADDTGIPNALVAGGVNEEDAIDVSYFQP